MTTNEMDLILDTERAGREGDTVTVHRNMAELVRLRWEDTPEWRKQKLLLLRESQLPKERARGLLTRQERDVLGVYHWPSEVPPALPVPKESKR